MTNAFMIKHYAGSVSGAKERTGGGGHVFPPSPFPWAGLIVDTCHQVSTLWLAHCRSRTMRTDLPSPTATLSTRISSC